MANEKVTGGSAEDTDAILSNNKRSVTISDGTQVEVYKITLRSIKQVLSFAENIASSLQIVLVNEGGVISGVSVANVAVPSDYLNLIAKNIDPFIDVLDSLTSIGNEKLQDLDMDDVLSLVIAVMEVNADFFTNRLLPMLKEYVPEINSIEQTTL